MPVSTRRGSRRRTFLPIALAAGALAIAGLALPATASAGSEYFCGGVWLASGWDCRGVDRAYLTSVEGYVLSPGSNTRICAATAVSNWGSLSSDWRCDYVSVIKYLDGSMIAVGAVRNGSTFTWQLWTGVSNW
jgi:hypothetical protein